MDSVKLIKKHGSPGGLPTLTAYVDEDAPGEAKPSVKKYLQRIRFAAGFELILVTETATPFTTADVADFLEALGYKNAATGLTITYTTPMVAGTDEGTLTSTTYNKIWGIVSPNKSIKTSITVNIYSIENGGLVRAYTSQEATTTVSQVFVQEL